MGERERDGVSDGNVLFEMEGAKVGWIVGVSVAMLGISLGEADGFEDSEVLGREDGTRDGSMESAKVGWIVGVSVATLGISLGEADGSEDREVLGRADGTRDGSLDGTLEGTLLGYTVGRELGSSEACNDLSCQYSKLMIVLELLIAVMKTDVS